MKESSLLETTRRVSLWATIGSAAVVTVLLILLTWGVISFTEQSLFSFGISAWGKLILTGLIIWAISLSVLVALLVSSHVKKTA